MSTIASDSIALKPTKYLGKEESSCSNSKVVTSSRSLSKALLMCAMAGVFYYYEYYLRVAPGVMKAELQQAFKISDFGFGHLSSCYYYAYILMQIPVGMMMDRFGPRRILTLACFLCVMGTFIFAHGTYAEAQMGRFLVGFGSAFAYVGVLKIATVQLPDRWFPIIAGCCSALGMLGAISGELVMGKLVSLHGWQSTLDIAAWTGVILMILLWLSLSNDNENSDGEPKLDLNKQAYSVSVSQSLLILVKSPSCWLNGLIGCMAYLPINAFAELWAVPYLQSIGYAKIHAAEATALVFLGFALGGPIAGIFSELLNSRKIPMFLGLVFSGLAMSALIWMDMSPTMVYICMFGCGLFAGFKVMAFAIAHDLEQGVNHATAIGFTNMLIMMGGIFVQPYIGKLLDVLRMVQVVDGQVIIYDYYAWALSILPLALFLGAILVYWLPESYQRNPQNS